MKHIKIVSFLFVFLLCSCSSPKQDGIDGEIIEEQEPYATAPSDANSADIKDKIGESKADLAIENNLSIPHSKAEDDIELNIENLIGLWQDAPSVGAAFGDCYFFYRDGTFKFNYSEFDGEKRTISLFGLWELSGNKLILTITENEVVEGGELVLASPSMSSEYEIEGGTYAIIQLTEPQIYEYLLSEITIDDETLENPDTGVGRKTIQIGDIQYWKFNDTAEEY